MKKILSLIIIFALILLPANANAEVLKKKIKYSSVSLKRNDIEDKQLIVVYKDGRRVTRSEFSTTTNEVASVKKVSKRIDVVQLDVGNSIEQTIEEISKDPDVASVGRNFVRHINSVPDDYYYQDMWHLPNIGFDETWNQVSTANQVVVAVIDTGIKSDHPEFSGRIVGGYDYYRNDSIPDDVEGHGTMVSGIIAAATNNATGVSGVSGTANVKIMPFKVGEGDELSGDAIVSSIYAAIDNNVDIINMSYGGYTSTPFKLQSSMPFEPEFVALQEAYAEGILLIAASGNEGDETDLKGGYSYPASYKNVVSVAATNQSNLRAPFSQYNTMVDVTAPGTYIISTNNNGGYSVGDGTSFSAPIVSGSAAVLLAKNPALTPLEIENLLKNYSDDLGTVGKDNYYGYGKVNLKRSLDNASPATPTPSAAPTAMPTLSPTPVPTTTPTPVPTTTPTPVSTATPTPVPTATITPSPTQTPMPTLSPSATASLTPTQIPTGTPVGTANPTPTPTSEPTPSASPTPVATSVATATPLSTATPQPKPKAKNYYMLLKGKLYQKASEKSKVMAVVKKGAKVEYKGTKGSFLKMKYKNNIGYIKKANIKIIGRWSVKTRSQVKARSGPGTRYKVKETYSKGTVLWITEQRGYWCRIYENNYWIHNDGLK